METKIGATRNAPKAAKALEFVRAGSYFGIVDRPAVVGPDNCNPVQAMCTDESKSSCRISIACL